MADGGVSPSALSRRKMSLLKSVETTIASLVEGAFGRVFRSEVRPIELARKLTREMDAHRTHSLSRVYVPNEYSVWLSREDRERYHGIEHEVAEELCAYLLEHARRESLVLPGAPQIQFHTDDRLSLGEFGIQARSVPTGGHAGEDAGPGAYHADLEETPEQHGQTMIYSTSARVGAPVQEAQGRPRRALLAVGGRRLLLDPEGSVVGRSRDCDIVLEDSGISRRHAEIRPGDEGWTVHDLGSTNGLTVNGRAVRDAHVLRAGDVIELGSTDIVFEEG